MGSTQFCECYIDLKFCFESFSVVFKIIKKIGPCDSSQCLHYPIACVSVYVCVFACVCVCN